MNYYTIMQLCFSAQKQRFQQGFAWDIINACSWGYQQEECQYFTKP